MNRPWLFLYLILPSTALALSKKMNLMVCLCVFIRADLHDSHLKMFITFPQVNAGADSKHNTRTTVKVLLQTASTNVLSHVNILTISALERGSLILSTGLVVCF